MTDPHPRAWSDTGRALACLALLSVTACAEANPGAPAAASLQEAFAAITMNGVALPFTLRTSGDTSFLLDYEMLRLYRDRSAVREQAIRSVNREGTQLGRLTLHSEFQVQSAGDTLRLVPTCAPAATCIAPLAFVRDGSSLRLTISSNPQRVVTYVRGLPF